MSHYIDVILPVPLHQKFTYLITEDEYKFIKPGMKIVVLLVNQNYTHQLLIKLTVILKVIMS